MTLRPVSAATVASVLAFVMALNGCAPRVVMSREENQSAEQAAQDQRDCEEKIYTSGRYLSMVGKAVGGGLIGPIVGGVVGAGFGVVIAFKGLGESNDPHPERTLGLAAAIGAAVGVVAGAVVVPSKAVQEEREGMARDFKRCMEERGYR